MLEKLKKNYLLIILIIIQTTFYIIAGSNKAYLHLDEVYSFGLSNYDKIEIEENEDFFDNWHIKDYYQDYLTVQENELLDFTPVYENQKNDVHPPLYYVLLRCAMDIAKGNFSKWTGIILNIIIYIFITILMYIILKKLLKAEVNSNTKAAILAFISSVTLASVSNAIYIRMYALQTLNILIITYLHIKLLENTKLNIKLLIAIGISVLTGILTHYYYIFYLGILYLIFLIKYIKEKRIKELIYYTITMIISGITSLIIFPYSINHMFFGYRGKDVINNLENLKQIIESIFPNLHNLNYYGFNYLLYIILGAIIVLIIYNKMKKKRISNMSKEERQILILIYLPSIFFFAVSSIASPWKVLRYIVPVCSLIFICTIYYLYKLLQTAFKDKVVNIIIGILFVAILVTPITFNLEPELLYTDRKEIVEKIGTELSTIPAIYLYNTQRGGFLDDIELFSKIEQSYIAKDIKYSEENIQKILKEKDTKSGVVVFISKEQESSSIIEIVKNAIGLESVEELKELAACVVYYVK